MVVIDHCRNAVFRAVLRLVHDGLQQLVSAHVPDVDDLGDVQGEELVCGVVDGEMLQRDTGRCLSVSAYSV